jgi:hypothetical protein
MLRIVYVSGDVQEIDVLGAVLVVKPAAPALDGTSHPNPEQVFSLNGDDIARIEADPSVPEEPADGRTEEIEFDAYEHHRSLGMPNLPPPVRLTVAVGPDYGGRPSTPAAAADEEPERRPVKVRRRRKSVPAVEASSGADARAAGVGIPTFGGDDEDG